MLLKFKLSVLQRFGALVRAMMKTSIAILLKMIVQLFITERLRTPMKMVRTFEL